MRVPPRRPLRRWPCRRVRRPARAFTLLEVIIALGILAVAVVVIGEVSRASHRSAARAAAGGPAALVAESVLAELEAQLVDLASTSGEWATVVGEPAEWTYTVTVAQTQVPELVEARIEVIEVTPRPEDAARFTVVRWFPNPDTLEAPAEDAEASDSQASGASASGAGGANGSGGTGTGGGGGGGGGGVGGGGPGQGGGP